MSERKPVRRALVSVYDKTGLVELATGLHQAGVELVSTGSTAARIADAGIPVTPVVLGLVLGPTLERELRTALIMSEGDVSVFYSSVPSLILTLS